MLNIEAKREKFIRHAEHGLNSIRKQFRILGNLSDKSNYEYIEDYVRKVFSELNKTLKKTKT